MEYKMDYKIIHQQKQQQKKCWKVKKKKTANKKVRSVNIFMGFVSFMLFILCL